MVMYIGRLTSPRFYGPLGYNAGHRRNVRDCFIPKAPSASFAMTDVKVLSIALLRKTLPPADFLDCVLNVCVKVMLLTYVRGSVGLFYLPLNKLAHLS